MSLFAATHGAQTWALQPGPAAGRSNSPAHSLFEAGKFGWGCTRRVWRCRPVEQATSAASSAGPLRISGTARLLQTRAPALEDHSHGVNVRPSSNAICIESIQCAPDFGPARRAQLLPFVETTWTTMSRCTTAARPPSTPGPRSRVLSFASNLPQASQPRAWIPAFRAVTPRPLSQRGRQPPHPSFPRQLCHRHHNLLPPIATQPLQSQPSSPQNPSATTTLTTQTPLKPQVVDR